MATAIATAIRSELSRVCYKRNFVNLRALKEDTKLVPRTTKGELVNLGKVEKRVFE